MESYQFNQDMIDKIKDHLFSIEGSLKGLSGLFRLGDCELALDKNELFGLGQLLEILSNEAAHLRNIIDSNEVQCSENVQK